MNESTLTGRIETKKKMIYNKYLEEKYDNQIIDNNPSLLFSVYYLYVKKQI